MIEKMMKPKKKNAWHIVNFIEFCGVCLNNIYFMGMNVSVLYDTHWNKRKLSTLFDRTEIKSIGN